MDNTEIKDYTDLMISIKLLKEKKFRQETELKSIFKNFANAHDPISILKGSIKSISSNREIQGDLLKVTINTGVHYLMGKILNRNLPIKDFLSSVMVEKISTTLTNINITGLIAKGIAFINPKKNQ
ncbi:MAG: hypothetical protein V4613_04705 [Bacteroidota bacterium]